MTTASQSILALLLLFVSNVSLSQQKAPIQTYIPVRFEVRPLELPFPFGKIEVADARPDTTKIGYQRGVTRYARLVAQGGLVSQFESALNKAAQKKQETAQEFSVLIVISKFWLTPSHSSNPQQQPDFGDTRTEERWRWRVNLEVYGNYDGAYTPLFRIDSFYPFVDSSNRYIIRADMLNECLQRLQKFDPVKLQTAKTKYSRHSVDSFYQAPYLKPVLTQTSLPVGVFRSFSDFVNQRIQHPDFALDTTDDGTQLYIVKNNQKELLTAYWGYCDGKKYYISVKDHFFELYRQANTFEFLAYSTLTPSKGNYKLGIPQRPYFSAGELAAGAALTGIGNSVIDGVERRKQTREVQKQRRPFQLNIETGNYF